MSPNLKAFLDTLAFSEGTSTHAATDNDGYDVIVTGLDDVLEIFTDYRFHPFEPSPLWPKGRPSKVINRHGLTSNAAGRYQQMLKFWPHYKLLLNLPDFGPESQDRCAVQQIKEQRALDDVLTGHFVIAVAKVSNLWASLPGANYPGQRMRTMTALEDAYERAGGTFA
jgi:muramidase (phage lysozyme)